jgi:hypothetical protein
VEKQKKSLRSEKSSKRKDLIIGNKWFLVSQSSQAAKTKVYRPEKKEKKINKRKRSQKGRKEKKV